MKKYLSLVSLTSFVFIISQHNALAKDPDLHVLEDRAAALNPTTLEEENKTIADIQKKIIDDLTDTRDAHPKDHGCVNATLVVDKNLPLNLQTGIYSKPDQDYPMILRFSSGSSKKDANDLAGGSQGLAGKILLPADLQNQVADIPGEEYFLEKKYYKTFDIITINGVEEFVGNDVKSYPLFTDTAKAVGIATEAAIAAGKSPQEIGQLAGQMFFVGYISKMKAELQPLIGALFQKLGSLRPKNVLAETYNSWVPYAYDADRAVKYSYRNCTDLSKSKAVDPSKNFLSAQLHQDVSANGGCFELWAVFYDKAMDVAAKASVIENASLPWGDAAKRSYTKVATVTLSNEFTAPDFCEKLSFNPLHALPNQRGIGGIQRARGLIYAGVETARNKNALKKK